MTYVLPLIIVVLFIQLFSRRTKDENLRANVTSAPACSGTPGRGGFYGRVVRLETMRRAEATVVGGKHLNLKAENTT